MKQNIQQKPDYRLIFILLSGAFVALLSNTFLNVALPSIKNDFDITTSTVQWVSTAYMLVSGIVIPTTAFLMQRFSSKTLFLAAMLLFLTGTLVAGLSPEFYVLLIGRMIQASGSAILMPLLMTVMITSFPPARRGTAMGLFSLVMFFAPAIGPTLSGFIVQSYSWHMLFFMMVPVLLIVLTIGWFKLPKTETKDAIKINIPSVILSTLGFGGILYCFSSAGNGGWTRPDVIITLVIGFISIFLYVRKQTHMAQPMLDFSVYKFPMFTLSSILIGTMNMALFSGMILMPIYLQDIQGISPIDTGLLLLPGALIMGFMSPASGKLFDMFGPKRLAITGLLLTVVTTYFFSRLTFDTSYGFLIMLYSIRAFGMTLVMTPVMTNGMNQLTPKLTPHGSSINSMLNQVSGAIGTALLITVMQNRMNAKLQGVSSTDDAVINQAMLDGINFAFLIATLMLLVALGLSFMLKRVTTDEILEDGITKARPIEED
ncbi:MDR family MFS transporter [Salinicoccus siamensis]|uniref:Quinolone resistance protein NorB n=1 Tax=Salinicoccus siamensis TaxID=381830 RepID=A0ABV5Z401_9STAP